MKSIFAFDPAIVRTRGQHNRSSEQHDLLLEYCQHRSYIIIIVRVIFLFVDRVSPLRGPSMGMKALLGSRNILSFLFNRTSLSTSIESHCRAIVFVLVTSWVEFRIDSGWSRWSRYEDIPKGWFCTEAIGSDDGIGKSILARVSPCFLKAFSYPWTLDKSESMVFQKVLQYVAKYKRQCI